MATIIMPFCINCGGGISEIQYNYFKGICLDCVSLSIKDDPEREKALQLLKELYYRREKKFIEFTSLCLIVFFMMFMLLVAHVFAFLIALPIVIVFCIWWAKTGQKQRINNYQLILQKNVIHKDAET